ncbi:MAG: LLM class flavin-dependent oxidoreductase [Ilumatobacteraceae bacterium]
MRTDIVLDPFGADAGRMVEVASAADEAGVDGVWVFDHLSGVVADASWAHDPFVLLGAIAGVASRARLGPLVANVLNRHPVALASAIGSLSALAPGRVVCGLGAGASPGSSFAVEHLALGRVLDGATTRRDRLAEHVEAFRRIWSAAGRDEPVTFEGEHVTLRDVTAIVPPGPVPPVVIGASASATVRLALEVADGVNIRRTSRLPELVALALDGPGELEVSVFESVDVSHPLGGDVDELLALGAHVRTLLVPADAEPAVVAAIVAACRERLGGSPDLSR